MTRCRFHHGFAVVVIAAAMCSCTWWNDLTVPGNQDFRNEEYTYSVLRSEKFLEKYRKPRRRRELAMINQGRAYMRLRAFTDAKRVFQQYVSEFPNGQFVGMAHDALGEVQQMADERETRLVENLAEAKKEAEAIEAKLKKDRSDPDLLVALGNAYWKLGQYKSAGEAYLEAITLKPGLRASPLMQERLIFDIDGNLIPIESPSQRVALERERNPLLLENVHEYTSRGVTDFFSARRRYYVVTGKVRNRSTRPILGVQIQVTLYDSVQQILEVGKANVGTLYPQQSRPFVVKSGLDAEAMNNIMRYECEALYQQ